MRKKLFHWFLSISTNFTQRNCLNENISLRDLNTVHIIVKSKKKSNHDPFWTPMVYGMICLHISSDF